VGEGQVCDARAVVRGATHLHIGTRVGDTPRNVTVVPQHHAWHAHEAGTDDVQARAWRADVVQQPHGGGGEVQVRVVAQEGQAAGGAVSAHHPVVTGGSATAGPQTQPGHA